MTGCGLQEESDGLPDEKNVAFLHRRRQKKQEEHQAGFSSY
jgi:hypothetical protein